MNAKHLFKSNFGQCECRWCGARRTAGDSPCEVTTEHRKWLAEFVAAWGRTWRHQLRKHWTEGRDCGIERQLRNIIGPNRLDRVSTRMIQQVGEQSA